ncbi:MAG TPA: ABC transporter ATP-binding protein [Chthoniobacterales bacterium]
MSELLEISGVTQRFGGLRAISDFNLAVKPGETIGVIGPNGAGKTTLFNLITGIFRPTEGTIRCRGKLLNDRLPNQIAALGIARTFQNIRLFRELTVLDNVRIAYDSQLRYSPLAALLTAPGQRRAEEESIRASLELLGLFQLAGLAGEDAGNLSYGSQRKLEIARALALKPSVLLLDEPAAGMNPSETRELTEFLRWVKSHFAVTILLIEHHMHLVMSLCQRIKVLDFGVTIAEGAPEEIRANPRVIEAYLGEKPEDA